MIDRLRQLGYDPIEVAFGGRASNAHYHDKRTEMYALGAEWLKDGGVLPRRCTRLKTELCAWTFDYKGTQGAMRLCSKDIVKETLRHSPDMSDLFAMAFAHPVYPQQTVGWQGNVGKMVTEYDPYRDEAVA